MLLYKYLTPSRADVLENLTIRFTQPAAFNDPFEFRPSIESLTSPPHRGEHIDDILQRELPKYPTLSQLPRKAVSDLLAPLIQSAKTQLLPRVSSAIDAAFNENVGVLCLSEVRDSLLMWGHYTENHEGFIVGFDQEHSFFSVRRGPEDEFGFLRKVKYRTSRPRVTLADTTGTEWFETKCEEWAYEREWRMMRVLRDADKRIEKSPHPICLFKFPADAVAEIVLGLRVRAALRDHLTLLSPRFSRAKLFQAHMHESRRDRRCRIVSAT